MSAKKRSSTEPKGDGITGFPFNAAREGSWKITLPCTKAEAERLAEDVPEIALLDPQPTLMTSEPDPDRPDAWQLDVYVESEPSPVLCISPTDTFPPKAPTNLAAVASEGAISLIWEANTEPDLAGYVVLRGEAPGATLAPLMTEPIKDTTYRDTTTKAGVRYVYTVVAVDTATPQNVSM